MCGDFFGAPAGLGNGSPAGIFASEHCDHAATDGLKLQPVAENAAAVVTDDAVVGGFEGAFGGGVLAPGVPAMYAALIIARQRVCHHLPPIVAGDAVGRNWAIQPADGDRGGVPDAKGAAPAGLGDADGDRYAPAAGRDSASARCMSSTLTLSIEGSVRTSWSSSCGLGASRCSLRARSRRQATVTLRA
jgi:hypothetical protein